MISKIYHGLLTALLIVPVALCGQQTSIEKKSLAVRGHSQELYRVVATNNSAQQFRGKILFAPGDGGWRGFAITMAENMAASGYEVYAIDTKHYLQSFTGAVPLTPQDVMNDFREIAQSFGASKASPMTLVGWSEGAGLCLLAAAPAQNKTLFNGLILIAATDTNLLGSRWSDYLASIAGKQPDEPSFSLVEYLPRAAPMPVALIQSTGDQYVSVPTSKELFAAAREPKQFVLIEARNHRFDGNHDELFRALSAALERVRPQPR